jgi:dihydroorotate dehydrogenase (NAD+) catalytic subunit
MPKLTVRIGKLKLKNPIMVASGTFGYGEEFRDFMDLSKLGAVVTKTITLRPRQGNPVPRTCETPAGMLNSIGLENPGLELFLKEKLPGLKKIGVPVIVSIASELNPQEFAVLAGRLDRVGAVAAIELNISCPNLRHTKLISQDASEIVEIARAAERGGSDAVSLINTLTAMSIDVERRRPKIAMGTGGLSGPAIRPVALRLVWEAAQKIKIPIIGMGGIIDTPSALEFFLAGATAVSVGTANFINPKASVEIIAGIRKYLAEHKIKDIKALIGSLKV